MSQRFIVTKEHRRFTEFADAVRRGHTIGLCFGSAGVGKTLSARRYAHYEKAHDLLTYWGPRSDNDAKIYAALNRSRTVLYTPSVLTTPRTLKDELTQAITRTNMCIEQHLVPPGTATPEAWGWRHGRNYVELIIVDEAERLRPAALELLRDRYDRDGIALILIGMPGLEKQFSHYPQFYSRVGFAHQYRPLSTDEMLFVLQRHWRSLGKTLNPDDFTDAQTIAAISRITRGNFRLLERLFPQIERVLKINELQTITNDVDHGTYPFVTSSNPTSGGAAVGSGIGPTRITTVLGILKAYTTRVGSGPFPTELFDQYGQYLAKTGGEVGVTTGRPRRCGWFDAVIARYATRVNGITDYFLTKLDVLSSLETVPICVGYSIDGKRTDEMPMTQSDIARAEPIYEEMPGWWEDISGAREFDDLPAKARDYVLRLEELAGAHVSCIGVGPGRDQTIVRRDILAS